MVNDISTTFEEWLNLIKQLAVSQFHRAAIVVSGEKEWGQKIAKSAVQKLSDDVVLWISDEFSNALPPKKACTQLGKEYEAIVFDAHERLDVDAFGAIAGTLRGGGLLLLLIPLKQDWSVLRASRFHQRVWALLENHSGVIFLQQWQTLPDIAATVNQKRVIQNVQPPFCTSDQQRVVHAIEESILKKKSRAIVLISDRGRGKSAALGFVAGRLLNKGLKKIIVTAPRLSTSDPVFKHAKDISFNASTGRGKLITDLACLQFMAPDALLIDRPEADLLLVDEAAAIPLQLLEQFLQQYPCVVYATTIHGYEGTGRGFSLKFGKILDSRSPGWQQFIMETPIRWAMHDQVEAWVDKILFMDAELQTVPDIDVIKKEACVVNLVDRDHLVINETRMSSLFALLVNAHYRTQPSDFRYMLDDRDVRLYVLEYQEYILGAVLINEEGGFDKELAEKIYRGERRPAGNLLAQTLCFHAGCEKAAKLNYARVMRIAIHPQLQGNGLGSYMLLKVIEQERKNVSAIGTSFGANAELLHFWKKSGFELVRIGFTRDHASGTHSAVMLMPLDQSGEVVFNEVRVRFQLYIESWLAGPLKDIQTEMKELLHQEELLDSLQLSPSDWKEVESFADTHRSYEATMWPLTKLVKSYPSVTNNLPFESSQIIQARIIENLDWSEVSKQVKARGKADAIERLRGAIKLFVQAVQKH